MTSNHSVGNPFISGPLSLWLFQSEGYKKKSTYEKETTKKSASQTNDEFEGDPVRGEQRKDESKTS